MDEIKPREEEEKSRSRRNVICRKTGNHVHYPRNRKTKSTRIRHAPPSSGLESLFKLARRKRYGECRKNQAAEIGTTAYDGCGEFVSDTTAGEEDSVKCVACGCHRNFHREELILENDVTETVLNRYPLHAVLEMLKISSDQFRHILCSPYGERKNEKEDRSSGGALAEGEGKVKRFKSKFTAEQKEKMRNYAEKLEWKLNRENEEEVDKICLEIGVMKKKFRNWMNNHKDKS